MRLRALGRVSLIVSSRSAFLGTPSVRPGEGGIKIELEMGQGKDATERIVRLVGSVFKTRVELVAQVHDRDVKPTDRL